MRRVAELALYQPGIFDNYYINTKACCDKGLAGKVRSIRGRRSGGRLWELLSQFISLVDSPVESIEECEDGEVSLVFSNKVTARSEGDASKNRWTVEGDGWTAHFSEGGRTAGSEECSYPRQRSRGNRPDACYVNYFNAIEGRERLRPSLSDARVAFQLLDTLGYRFA